MAKNKTILVFPDSNASFQSYLHKEEALRKRDMCKALRSRLRTLTNAVDPGGLTKSATAQIEQIRKIEEIRKADTPHQS